MQAYIQLETGDVLELSKEFAAPLNYSVDDIANPTNRDTAYSKTLTIPGNKNANEVFGALFNVNADFTYFDPNVKVGANVVSDGDIPMSGYLQLLNIKKMNTSDLQGNFIQYECVVFDVANNFFTNIGDKLLSDLDFSEFDHDYTHDNIVATWTAGHQYTPSTVYAYPMCYKNSTSYKTSDFKPAIFHKAYLEKIAAAQGRTLSGSFMSFAPYDREVIPFTNEQLVLSDQEISNRSFMAQTTDGGNNFAFPLNQYFDYWSPGVFLRGHTMNNDSVAPAFDNGNNFAGSAFTVPANGVYALNYVGQVEVRQNPAVPIPNPPNFAIAASVPYGTSFPTFLTAPNPAQLLIGIRMYKNGVQFGVPVATLVTLDSIMTNATTSKSYVLNGNFYTGALSAGDVITMKSDYIIAGNQQMRYGYMDDPFSPTWITWILDFRFNSNNFFFNQPQGGQITDGDPIAMNDVIPKDMKQIDVWTDLIKRYNLFVTVNPADENDLVLQTREDYYNNATVRMDVTDKKDYSSEDKIELLSGLQNKEMHFKYTPSDDLWNKTYRDVTKKDYGEHRIVFANEFASGVRTVQTPFSPTPLIWAENTSNPSASGIVVPALDCVKTETKPRVLYFDGAMASPEGTTSFTFDYIDGAGASQQSAHTAYPYAGHFDNPFAPTLDLNYGVCESYFYEFGDAPADNLYRTYWSSYVEQMTTSKLVTSKFFITATDVANVKNAMNTKVFVKDSWYYINKIIDFDPVHLGVTTVQLVKINEGVEFMIRPKGTPRANTVSNPRGTGGTKKLLSFAGIPHVIDSTNDSSSSKVQMLGDHNTIGENSNGTFIVGDDNVIEGGVTGAGILGGSGNRITAGVENAWIIGADDKTVTQSGEIWFGDVHVLNGRVVPEYNLIRGSEDAVFNQFAVAPYNLIRGGEDTVKAYNITAPYNVIRPT